MDKTYILVLCFSVFLNNVNNVSLEVLIEKTTTSSTGLLQHPTECGRVQKESLPNITNTELGFPWFVAIYRKYGDEGWEYVCGGTLISPHIVLTAAHCVVDVVAKKKISASEFKVALGKLYKEWDHEEPSAQKRNVREIAVPDFQQLLETNFKLDMGLLDLDKSVEINSKVVPACIDWEQSFTPTHGVFGYLTRWNSDEKAQTPVLETVKLTYHNKEKCKENLPVSFLRFLANTKFCAGSSGAPVFIRASSGSGYSVVNENGQHTIIGVLSLAMKGQNSYALFTNITDSILLNWMTEQKKMLDTYHNNKN